MSLVLTAADGHTFNCFVATPKHAPQGAVVVIQEIFGVNAHIRAVCERYAEAGYLALAPALFDRVKPNVELGYGPEDRNEAMTLAFQKITLEQALSDIQAAVDHASSQLKVGVVGYCFGGLLAWLAACELKNISAVSSYYGGGIGRFKEKQPQCPIQLHFGRQDPLIPMQDVDALKILHPECKVYVYDAGHGFNCDQRPSYHADSSQLAWTRTLSLFQTQLSTADS